MHQARIDVSARGLIFDVRVFNPTEKRNVDHELRKPYKVNEKEKKKNKFCIGKILFVHVYVVANLFSILQAHTQRIRCLHLQRLAKLDQMLVQLYYPFELPTLHTLHATTLLNVI